MNIKSIIPIFLVFLLILSTAGAAFAAADATISVAFDKDNVKVGDKVNMIVTITNTGDQDLNSIFVLAPLPDGLKFLMSVTGTSKNLYNPDTGVWQVDNLRLTSKGGGVKKITITAEVLPSLKGKQISTYAKYTNIAYGDPPISIIGQVSQANSNTLTISGDEIDSSATDKIDTSDTINVPPIIDSDTKNTLKKVIKNTTKSSGGVGSGENSNHPAKKTAYEVSSTNSSDSSKDQNTIYAIIGGLIIAILIVIGYFKGVKS